MPQRTLTKRGFKRRRQVMEAGYRLFAEEGYHGTTVRDVCEVLGVGTGVFYWYFPSKEALFAELLQSSLLQLRRAQRSAIAGVEDPLTRIERGIRASIEFFRATPGFLSLSRTAARYEEFARFVEEGQETVVKDVAAHIQEGMTAGSIRQGDPELMAHAILGAILHCVETYFGTEADAVQQRPQLADEVVAFCITGILQSHQDG